MAVALFYKMSVGKGNVPFGNPERPVLNAETCRSALSNGTFRNPKWGVCAIS